MYFLNPSRTHFNLFRMQISGCLVPSPLFALAPPSPPPWSMFDQVWQEYPLSSCALYISQYYPSFPPTPFILLWALPVDL